ncbi:MAG: ammonium transporter [Desulfurococcales archaeon]|nr:ammonium transporter [Desulfurococcales archaeon]
MGSVDPSATAWLLASTALVVAMVFGVAFFYSGLVRRKNAVNMIATSVMALSVAGVQWVLVGFTLAFSGDALWGFSGDLKALGLRGYGLEAPEGLSVPGALYAAFQGAFAAVTAAILTSPFAERASFLGFTVFTLAWLTLVYSIVAHWVWAGGLADKVAYALTGEHPVDFAGGLVVHTASGFSALAVALVLGPREGYGMRQFQPHNIPLSALGAAILWAGWFGFNAGSALEASGLAGNALLVTHVAASSGALAWGVASWVFNGRPGLLGMLSGAIAGLVAITPASGYVNPLDAIVIGALGALASYLALSWRLRSGVDESLDAWAIHGVAGLTGSLLTGVFARQGIGGVAGLLEGNPSLLAAQLVAAVVVVVYSLIASYLIALAVDKTLGLRVKPEEEMVGLDISQHAEEAYGWAEA